MQIAKGWLILLVGAVLVLLLAGCRDATTPMSSESNLPVAPREGALAPDFTLRELGGAEVRLSELRGKVVLLNFWATWCPYCRAERSALQKAHEQYSGRGVVILSVNIGEKQGVVQAFAEARKLTMTVLLDEDGTVARAYHVQGIPVSFLIDRDGIIRSRHLGLLNELLIMQYVQLVP